MVTEGTSASAVKNTAEKLDPKDYAAFIAQIELQTIWLKDALVENEHGPETPERGVIRIEEETEWQPLPAGFRAFHRYRVRMEAGSESLLTIAVTYAVDFFSEETMTDEIFAVFQRVNLPVNTWPYLREYVATMMGRMDWMPFTLPALKRGTRAASKRQSASTKRSSKATVSAKDVE